MLVVFFLFVWVVIYLFFYPDPGRKTGSYLFYLKKAQKEIKDIRKKTSRD